MASGGSRSTVRALVILIIAFMAGALGSGQSHALAGPGPSHPLAKALAPLAGPRDAVLLIDQGGQTIVALNADTPLVPASILKLLTAMAALEKMGPEYRFRTEFYLDQQNNLIIKGYGDPLLISERLTDIATRLAGKITWINDLILDGSYVTQPVVIPGRGKSDEPYDAPNGALCVNFNTVAFRFDKGQWVSDEPQTPLLPSVIPKIKASKLKLGRITLAANSAQARQYTGELFHFFLNQAGIQVKGVIRGGSADPHRNTLLWRYLSQDNLAAAVAKLLEFSNNFIANQILLVMGARQSGPPATMAKGLEVIRRYYEKDLGIGSGHIVEASGISRQNSMTARAMMTILDRFTPYHPLMRQQGRQFYKTGHLKGIRTRAGYLTSAKGGLYRFVVMINTPGKSTDRIMRVLERYLK